MNYKKSFINITITRNETIKEALKKMDLSGEKTLIVVDANNKFLGVISDGDLRRSILHNNNLNSIVGEIYNKTPFYIEKEVTDETKIKDILVNNKIFLLPVVDENKVLIGYLTWDELFKKQQSTSKPVNKDLENTPVVIMAGGKGTRLEPFTKLFPKALVPFGDATILEYIINCFKTNGVKNYHIIINYKANMVESYINSIDKDYSVNFILEQSYLGTAGGLHYLAEKISTPFIVSNCDIIVKADYADVFSYHKTQKADLTILSSIQHYKIPYGVVNFENGGCVTRIEEKPEFTFPVNTGVYIIDDSVLKYIPKNIKFDMTDLIDVLIKNKKKVITYPVNEKDYIDIGEWSSYKAANNFVL